jgi:hypothetical protein
MQAPNVTGTAARGPPVRDLSLARSTKKGAATVAKFWMDEALPLTSPSKVNFNGKSFAGTKVRTPSHPVPLGLKRCNVLLSPPLKGGASFPLHSPRVPRAPQHLSLVPESPKPFFTTTLDGGFLQGW